MEKSTKRMDIGGRKKFQEVKKRAEELKLLASRMSSDSDIDFLQGIERAAFDLTQRARSGSPTAPSCRKQSTRGLLSSTLTALCSAAATRL
jgi:hypothetical protein